MARFCSAAMRDIRAWAGHSVWIDEIKGAIKILLHFGPLSTLPPQADKIARDVYDIGGGQECLQG